MEDTFQVRLDFTSLLRRLNASQQSIQKVLLFADRHAARSSSDIWDCILKECAKASLSSRLNILFMLDFLYTDYATASSSSGSTAASRQHLLSSFRTLAERDLAELIDAVVPADSWEGIKLNSSVTSQILQSWRLKRIFPQNQLSNLLKTLEQRRKDVNQLSSQQRQHQNGTAGQTSLTKDEVIRRIEEDRERHKRIREKLWVLPPRTYVDIGLGSPAVTSNSSLDPRPNKKPRLAVPQDSTPGLSGEEAVSQTNHRTEGLEDPDDVEFAELWETTSDLNEDDLAAWREDQEEKWWGSETLLQSRRAKLQSIQDMREAESQRLADAQQAAPRSEAQPRKEDRLRHGRSWRDEDSARGDLDRRHLLDNSTSNYSTRPPPPQTSGNQWPNRRGYGPYQSGVGSGGGGGRRGRPPPGLSGPQQQGPPRGGRWGQSAQAGSNGRHRW